MREALALQAYAREKDAQAAEVASRDQAFDVLYQAVCRQGALKNVPGKAAFAETFGTPVLVEEIGDSGGEKWLYRQATRYFEGPRVYVFFSAEDRLDRVVCQESS